MDLSSMFSFSNIVKNSNFSSIENIQNLHLSPFPKINEFEKNYTFKYCYLITGIATAVFSAFIGWYALGALLAITFVYKSIRVIHVETDSYTNHINYINQLFDPFIESFINGYHLKAEGIHKAMKGINVISDEEAREVIQLLGKIYDREAKPTEWKYRTSLIENTTDDKIYQRVKMTAKKLVAFNLDSLSCDDLVKRKITRLKNSAYLFLYGTEGGDNYIKKMAADRYFLIPCRINPDAIYFNYALQNGELTMSENSILDDVF